MTDKIKVFVRLRPPLKEGPTDMTNGYDEVLQYTEHRLCPLQGKEADRGKDGYVFQKVFGPSSNNSDVFQEVKDVSTGVLEGVSGTVLAYGQTATGKTHTMRGSERDAGLSERILSQIFAEAAARPDWNYAIEAAYFEIYNEKVYDLLSGSAKELEVRVDMVQGLRFEPVSHLVAAKHVLERAEANRKKGRTDLNDHSSRSHTVLRLQVVGNNGAKRRMAQLHLVDLAGSENAKAAGYNSEFTQREGGAINRSLLALTNVIQGLAEKKTHIAYRDSKLTRILTSSLGGSARTYIICCITPALKFFSETMSTIHFADRARVVFNAVKVNEVDGTLSVAWEDHIQLHAMHQEDLAVAEQREVVMSRRAATEAVFVQTVSVKEHEATVKLFTELDFLMQQRLAAANTKLQEYEQQVRTDFTEAKHMVNNEFPVILKRMRESLDELRTLRDSKGLNRIAVSPEPELKKRKGVKR